MDAEHPSLTTFLKYWNIDKLTREILGELIGHIKAYEGGNISVKFKYTSCFWTPPDTYLVSEGLLLLLSV